MSPEAVLLTAMLAVLPAAEFSTVPDWVPGWGPGAVFVLGLIGAVYRAWPALKRAGAWLAGLIADAVMHQLREDLAAEFAAVRGEISAVREAVKDHADESAAGLAAVTDQLLDHVNRHHAGGKP